MRFARLDHIVLQVPDIVEAHARLLALGFDEAWGIGRTWPYGPTSGIALGRINLELLQPDEDPPQSPCLSEMVFEPCSDVPLETYGLVVDKVESDAAKLAARGFPPAFQTGPQRICTNVFPGPDAAWPYFVCQYAPLLAHRLSGGRFAAPYGAVRRVEIGPLRARPRFIGLRTEPDLDRFLSEIVLKTGPKLIAGEDRVTFESGAHLELSHLTIRV